MCYIGCPVIECLFDRGSGPECDIITACHVEEEQVSECSDWERPLIFLKINIGCMGNAQPSQKWLKWPFKNMSFPITGMEVCVIYRGLVFKASSL